MKKIKLLMPLGIATLATAMMPLVSCGCGNNSSWEKVAAENTFSEGADWTLAKVLVMNFENLKTGVTYQVNITFPDEPSTYEKFGSFYSFGIYAEEESAASNHDRSNSDSPGPFNSIKHAHLKINDKVFGQIEKANKDDDGYPSINKEFMA